MRILRWLVTACLSFGTFAVPAWAVQTRQVSVGAGVDDGGAIIGSHFDFNDTANESYGAYAQLYSKDRNKGQPGLFALGAHFRGHTKIGIFDYYLAPGFGMLHHSLKKTELLFGPSLSYGLTADLDKSIALGIEISKFYSWVGEYKGLIKDSFLATFRYNLP